MKTSNTKPDGLSPQEQQLIAMFRTTDNIGRISVMTMAGVQARNNPEPARPKLRLVKGEHHEITN